MDQKIISTNPADNYKVIGEVDCTSELVIPKIVKNSRIAFTKWRNTTLNERIILIYKIVELLKIHKDEISNLISLEMGMPKNDSEFDVTSGIQTIYGYIEQSRKFLATKYLLINEEKHTTIREPLGVILAIAPWNYPIGNFIWLCIQALLAGNVIIYKASSKIPFCCKKIEEIVNNILPDNVFTVVYGGHFLVKRVIKEKVDAISLVGSTNAGIEIAKLAAKNLTPINLELGGSAPGVVLKDIDLDLVTEKIVLYRFMNTGQSCDGLKRLIVDETIVDVLTLKLLKRINKLTIGDPLRQNSVDLGPLASQGQQKNISEQVNDAVEQGAKILCGGRCLPGGAYYTPTLLTNIKSSMRVWKEEVFGPILPIVSFSNISEAIKLANDTIYGLGGYVFTNDDKLFNYISRELETCMINRNGVSYVRKENFFGGCKMSGYGRENALQGFEHVTKDKIISE